MTPKQLQKQSDLLWKKLEDCLNPDELSIVAKLLEVEIELEALSNQ